MVTSTATTPDAVLVGYEFLTLSGSHHAEHRFRLEVSAPYQFGSYEADAAHAAERYLRAYQVGCPARVRYNPKKVYECVLARPRAQAVPFQNRAVESPAV
jgi:hypothetical protein